MGVPFSAILAEVAEMFDSWEGGDRRACGDFDGTSIVAPKATGVAWAAAIAATVGMWFGCGGKGCTLSMADANVVNGRREPWET